MRFLEMSDKSLTRERGGDSFGNIIKCAMIITIIIAISAQIFIVVYNKIYKNTKNIWKIATISGTYAHSVAFNNDCKNCKNY